MERVEDFGASAAVLGPIELRVGGRVIDLGTPRQRAIMAALALSANRPITFPALVDRVWGEAAPATAVGTLQRYVASLRRALEPDLAPSQTPSVLCTSGPAYVLVTAGGTSDVERFEEAVKQARRLLTAIPDQLRPGVTSEAARDVAAALDLLDDVLKLWRGEPYAELEDHDGKVVAERARLHDLREGAIEQRLIAMLALGRHAEAVGDLEAMTDLHPLHERWWALRAVSLFRSGRQADALRVLGTVRELLADELGVDPSPPLQQLYSDILRHDPSLEWRGIEGVVDAPGAAGPPGARFSSKPPLPRWRLVGRDREAGALRRLALSEGRLTSRTALVTGEAGVGKTRLTQEVMHAAHDAGSTVVVARCSQHAPPLWPFGLVLDELGRGDVLTEPNLTGADFGTWQRVVSALKRAAREAPLLLVLEDLQRADPATLHLASHLISEHDVVGLTLILTRRTHEGDDGGLRSLAAAVARADGVRIDLQPLDDHHAQELALLTNPGVEDPADAARRSGGIPYFATELAHANGAVSASLRDVVVASTSALEEDVRTVIGMASHLGDTFTADQLAATGALSQDGGTASLRDAVRSGILRCGTLGEAWFEFSAPVVREVVRDLLDHHTVRRSRAGHCPDVDAPSMSSRRHRRTDGTADVSAETDEGTHVVAATVGRHQAGRAPARVPHTAVQSDFEAIGTDEQESVAFPRVQRAALVPRAS